MNINSIMKRDISYFTGVRLIAVSIALYLTERFLYHERTVEELGFITLVMTGIIGVVVALLHKKECVSHGLDYLFSSVMWWVIGSGAVVVLGSYFIGGDGFRLLVTCLYVGGVLGVRMNPIIKGEEETITDLVETDE